MQLIHMSSTCADGNMSFRYGERHVVLDNRVRFLSRLGVAIDDCVSMSLEHGVRCVTVTAKDTKRGMVTADGIPADCFITTEPNVFLFLYTADCLPVSIYAPAQNLVALAHLARKNAELQFVDQIIQIIATTSGSLPSKLQVTIGPGIHRESYRLPLSAVRINYEVWGAQAAQGNTEVTLDLPGLVVRQLQQAGVAPENITCSPVNTATSRDYFSHYRSARSREPEARFATVIGFKN
ncbi:MAG: laccase domain-containing protein [Patescibacteria group bacterium]